MFEPLATITLGPLLLWQGWRVRLNVPRLPEAPGPRQGRAGKGPLLRLLIVGDSAAAGVGAAHQDEA
ncbi:MAG: SGNH/GDSL hydrolase family protein, partial [Candidatus Dadabacteria bacterium]